MVETAQRSVDGRRARRERSRTAVIDAVFALVQEGKVPPSVDELAERSGVSVSSIFRMFDGLDDMRSQAFEEFQRRYAHLFAADVGVDEPRGERIDRFVRARVELCTGAGPLLSLARNRAIDHEPTADRVAAYRTQLADQTRRCFSAEARRLTPAEAANLLAVIDATTAPDAYAVLGAAHARTQRQIERTWRTAIAALVDSWCGPADHESTSRKELS